MWGKAAVPDSSRRCGARPARRGGTTRHDRAGPARRGKSLAGTVGSYTRARLGHYVQTSGEDDATGMKLGWRIQARG